MDAAYDHIAEQSYAYDRSLTPKPSNDQSQISDPSQQQQANQKPTLQTEFQETFKAFSTSSWGTKLGGFWGNVRKQGESYYEEARKEAEDLGADALKWSEGLREKVVSSVGSNVGAATGAVGSRGRSGTVRALEHDDKDGDENKVVIDDKQDPDSIDKDRALQENETFIERFKAEAARRLKEVQKAEDAADEALVRFGNNITNFLRDAVLVTAPEAVMGNNASEVLFESKDATTGKRVIHTSRFEAQLHVIHTTMGSFTTDPNTDEAEWSAWKGQFDVDQKTDAIAKDLQKYDDLRSTMEKLVPEKVEYKDFWTRYYFLRHVVEMQEEKRREMLKASAGGDDEEEVAWDNDSDDDDEKTTAKMASKIVDPSANGSTSTLRQNEAVPSTSTATHLLKPAEGRRSHDEKSVADSDASYDLVSGATSRAPSRAPGSPAVAAAAAKAGESDDEEEDWE